MAEPELYVASSSLPVSVEEAFAYHERPGALDRLIPPWESVKIEQSDRSLEVGSRVVMKTRFAGIPLRWSAEHVGYDPPNEFSDKQVSGPFGSWLHRHQFEAAGRYSILRDSIRYTLPMGALGRLAGGGVALRLMESMFAYRHRVTRDDLRLQADYPSTPLTVAISGQTGLVGSRMSNLLSLLGHRVMPIVRQASQSPNEIAVWHSLDESEKFRGVGAVVHLAGKSIADQRWSPEVKQEIRDSRVNKTRQLCESLAGLDEKPKVLICASATGIYGNRGDEVLDEDSAPGEGFLADVAREWEEACRPAIEAGIRVVHARFGLILTVAGGALAKMMLPAKLAGGSLGKGGQWWSWIAIDDVLGGIYHAIRTDSLSGPVNFVSPEPVTNREFATTLANTLGRPALVPAPPAAIKLALGEMAGPLLFDSYRVLPQKLEESNYQFRFANLAEALSYSTGRERLVSAV